MEADLILALLLLRTGLARFWFCCVVFGFSGVSSELSYCLRLLLLPDRLRVADDADDGVGSLMQALGRVLLESVSSL